MISIILCAAKTLFLTSSQNLLFNHQGIKEIRKLRKQLTSEINLSMDGVNVTVDPQMRPPDDNQARLLRQLLLCGLGDQVGKKIALEEVKQGQ